ncbi:hypothetical protein FRC18_006499, partial [Serendipita sp. 400]
TLSPLNYPPTSGSCRAESLNYPKRHFATAQDLLLLSMSLYFFLMTIASYNRRWATAIEHPSYWGVWCMLGARDLHQVYWIDIRRPR